MSSKRIMRLLGITLLLVAFAATGALGQDRTKVTVWLIGDEVTGSYGQVWAKIKEHIETDLPHIEIDMVFGASPDQRYTVAYAAGIAPDVVTLSTAMAPQFIKAGMVTPLDYSAFGVKDAEELKDLFYPGSLRSMYAIDDIYFMPVELTTFGMYYNKDLMEEAGVGADQVPETWDEIMELGKKFMKRTADGDSFDTVGLAVNTSWIWPVYRWAALLRQAGTDWLVNDKAMFDSPQALEAMTMYSSLFHENQVTIPSTGQAAFVNQRAAFYLGPSYEMRATDLPAQARFDFGTASYPYMTPEHRISTSYAWGLYVANTSQVKPEAWEVINYLTSERWAPTWFETSALLIPRAGDWIMDVIHNQPLLAPFIMELEYAQMEMIHEEYTQMRTAIVAAENALINRTDSVQNVLTTLNHQIDVALNQ